MIQAENKREKRMKTRDRYDEVSLQFPKGTKNILKRLAEEQDCRNPETNQLSVNYLIVQAIERTYHIDLQSHEGL